MGQWAHSVDMCAPSHSVTIENCDTMLRYKRALKIKPHHPDATNNMCSVNPPFNVLSELSRAISAPRANALRGMGMHRKAQQILEKAIKKHPGPHLPTTKLPAPP